jgi:site-specific recombinase XerD
MDGPKTKPGTVLVAGPLAPFVPAFESKLTDAGYTPLTAVTQKRLLAHVSRWLAAKGLNVGELTDARVQEFLDSRRARGCTWLMTREGLIPLLELLAEQGVLPAPELRVVESSVDVLLANFRGYLLEERGLVASTADAYVLRARRFVAGCAPTGHLHDVCTSDVTRAILAESTSLSVGAAQFFVAALRSFLRFCSMEGLVTTDLSAAALAVTGRRRSSLPKGISPTDANALLNSCDRHMAVGRRDYAVIVMLLRLGLRANEVAALSLDDLDWRAAEVMVLRKGRRYSRLPLPDDVGEAIATYLQQGRPKTTSREVFVAAQAPLVAIGRGGVASIVRRACVRVGLPEVGTHRLRHTVACEMVRRGVPLAQIGQVLRHRSLSSTAIYARVDLDQLRQLAQPWPVGSLDR